MSWFLKHIYDNLELFVCLGFWFCRLPQRRYTLVIDFERTPCCFLFIGICFCAYGRECMLFTDYSCLTTIQLSSTYRCLPKQPKRAREHTFYWSKGLNVHPANVPPPEQTTDSRIPNNPTGQYTALRTRYIIEPLRMQHQC